jgi:Methyltransferase domain
MKRYGKSAEGILGVRQNFFAENDACLATAARHADLYLAQPRRANCKLCAAPLPSVPDFLKLGIPYASCASCTQLNGLREDTEAFCRAIYLDADYGVYYGSADSERYRYRVGAVYRPKIDFLVEALSEDGRRAREMSYADFGAGSGYLVAAMLDAGLTSCGGYEVSPDQVAYANRNIGEDRVRLIPIESAADAVRTLNAEVVSMIGVLEHLRELRAVLKALRENPVPQYLYLCVPLFGFCVFLEMAFPHVYPRHLVSDHTHLFTPQSLAWMEKEFGLERCAEWWFGSDMLDLYRQTSVTLARNEATSGMVDAWDRMMRPLIDPMQLAIDRQHLASEVHLLLRIRR